MQDEGNHYYNELKVDLRKESLEKLNKRLVELNVSVIKERHKKDYKKFNYQKTRKTIAIIKTIINERR